MKCNAPWTAPKASPRPSSRPSSPTPRLAQRSPGSNVAATSHQRITGTSSPTSTGEWPSYEVVDVTRDLAGIAGALAARHVLRGFDAVHLASAVVLKAARGLYSREASERGEAGMPPQVRLMTYDGALLAAARGEDLAYEMPNAASEDDSI